MDKDTKNPNQFKINRLGFFFYLLNVPSLTWKKRENSGAGIYTIKAMKKENKYLGHLCSIVILPISCPKYNHFFSKNCQPFLESLPFFTTLSVRCG
jgi:hypothetical protein